jgi:hypothetical protein
MNHKANKIHMVMQHKTQAKAAGQEQCKVLQGIISHFAATWTRNN